MNSLQATKTPSYLTLGGREFRVRQLSLAEWAEVQAWLRRQMPSPIAAAHRGIMELEADGTKLEDPTKKSIMAQAYEEDRNFPPRVGSWQWFQTLAIFDRGPPVAIKVILAVAGQQVSDAEADELYIAATADEMGLLWNVALHGDQRVPKATTGTTEPTSSPTETPTSGG